MDEHMGRRTVGGLLLTKGGSILVFREDSSRRKAAACCSRLGCGGEKDGTLNRAAAVAQSTPRRSSQALVRDRRPPPVSAAVDTSAGRSAEAPGRDLLARLKERVSASRKRPPPLTRETSPSSPGGLGFGTSSSSSASSSGGSGSRSVSRPSRRAASQVRRADDSHAGGAGVARRGDAGEDARRSAARSGDDDFLLVDQAARDEAAASTEGFISGFLARYRTGLHGGLASLEGDDMEEDASGYWRFDMEGTEELENYFMLNDRHRAMRMDIDGLSYEELLALGERMGTVSTGLSDDALSKCLHKSMYTPTASEALEEDFDRKCSVCQEEYSAGEEVGEMACKHYYHVSCIQQWLRLKNWCPICKSVALNATR